MVGAEALAAALEDPVPTGTTPRDLVWTRNKTALYRYRGERAPTLGTPVLLVYALINRPYIFDLRPGNSFVHHLLERGHDVFLLDWGRHGWEDRHTTLDELVGEHLPQAVRRMLRASGAEGYTLFGYCMGGTMAVAHASLHPERVRNLVALTTPIDFSAAQLHRAWTDRRHLDAEAIARDFGNIPGTLIGLGNKMLRPTANFVDVHSAMAEAALAGHDMTSWKAMNQWVNDGVSFPGAAFAQWIGDLYQQNRLVERRWRIAGRTVDPSSIDAALLTVVGSRDHIVPPAMATPLTDMVSSSDREHLEMDAGHVGLLAGSGARTRLWPLVSDWLAPRST